MFYAISDNQEFWKERLNLWVALAPVTKLDHCKSLLMQELSKFESLVESTLNFLHVYDLLGGPASAGTKIACGTFPWICQFGEGFLITQNPTLDDPERFQVYMGHFPAGASTQSLMHYAQMLKSKTWKLYDWGKKTNNEKYGQDTPPEV